MPFYLRAAAFPRRLRSFRSLGTFLTLLQVNFFLPAQASQRLICKITDSPSPAGVALGFHGNLNCSVIQGGPAESITWTKDKKPFGGTIVTLHNRSLYWSSLQFVNVSQGDDGKYECSVRKGDQSEEDHFLLRVFIAPLIIEKEREIQVLSQPTDTTLTCKASGWPEPSLVWTKNGVPKSTTYNIAGSLRLRIVSPKKEDKDNYTCFANNSQGRDSYSILVFVSGLPGSQPKITTREPYVISALGKNATLRCEGSYNTKHQWQLVATWEMNGKEIVWNKIGRRQCQESYEVGENSIKFNISLKIFNVSRQDTGIYVCFMSSTYSSYSPRKEIQLILDERDTRPKVSTSQAIVTANLNTSVTLECVTTLPHLLEAEYLWYFNGALVQDSPQRKCHQNSLRTDGNVSIRTTFSLEFMAVTARDFGCYTCGANSSLGWINTQVYLRARQQETGAEGNYSEMLLTISVATIAGSLLSLAAALILCRTMKRKRTTQHFYSAALNKQAFRYDVFVSFSGQDFAWINTNLVPLLEDHKLKYCIHSRDFELGRSIVENMAESVYTSRKVLVVLSKNYVTSKFCQGELEMAVQRSTVQKDCSLIVLRLDDVCIDVLPKCLRKKTFLDYSDHAERNTWQARLPKHLTKAPKPSSPGEKSDVDAPLLKV